MKQTRRFLALLLALCLFWSEVSPAFALALDEEQTEPVVVAEETVAAEVPETEAVTEAPMIEETEAPAVEPEVIETEAPEVVETEVAEEVVAEEAADEEVTEEPALGSEENPIVLEEEIWTWDEYHFERTTTIVVPVGSTYYKIEANGMALLTINGVETVDLMANNVFALTNNGEAEAEYTLVQTFWVGSMMNPEELDSLNNIEITFAEADDDGYFYSYTATEACTVTLTGTPIEGVEYQVNLSTRQDYENSDSMLENGNYTVSLELAEGDILIIQILVPSEGIPATVTLTGEITSIAPGSSAENPIVLDTTSLTWDDNFISARTTVTVPVGTTWYSIVITDMVINVDAIPVSGALYGSEPQVFSITNDGDAPVEKEIILAYPVGSSFNFASLTLGDNTAFIPAGNQGGYCTRWYAPADGELTITVDTSAPVWKFSVVTFDAEGMPVDRTHSSADDTIVASETITVAAGEQVDLIFSTWVDRTTTNPRGIINFTATFEETIVPGSSAENPLELYPNLWTWNDANTEGTYVLTIPAGATYFFNLYNAVGKELTVNDGEPELLTAMFPMAPVAYQITNDSSEDKVYTLKLALPAGSMSNPKVIEAGTYSQTLTGMSPDYHYTFTAPSAGIVTVSIDGNPGWQYCVNNVTTGKYGDNHWSDDAQVVPSETLIVSAGDQLTITTVFYDPTYAAAEGTVSMTLAFEPAVQIVDSNTKTENVIEFKMKVPAGQTLLYQGRVSGMKMEIKADDVVAVNNGTTYTSENGVLSFVVSGGDFFNPPTIAVTNNSSKTVTYSATFSWPEGTMNNPEALTELTGGTVSLAENSEGYYYSFTAPEDGYYVFSIASATEGVDADVVVSKTLENDVVISRSLLDDGVDNYGLELTMDVAKGDKLTIQVMVMPVWGMNGPSAPAADITWAATYYAPLGSKENPIQVEFAANEDWTVFTATVNVPAATTNYYYAYNIGGKLLSIDGGKPTLLPEGFMMAPVNFQVTNSGVEAKDFVLTLTYPEGSSMNPAELQLADEWNPDVVNVAKVAENSWTGYQFNWTATAQGELTITMLTGKVGWSYVINNMTSYAYGDTHSSADDEVISSETISVNEGDLIQIMVNTCGAEQYGATPAGEVHFTAEFAPTMGIATNPYYINEPTVPMTGTIKAGDTLYFNGYGLGGTTMVMENAAGLTVNVDGADYTADENGVITLVVPQPMFMMMPTTITITNTTDAAVEYSFVFELPVGTWENPAEMVIGENTADVAADSWSGYLFNWTATERGELTITMGESTNGWVYSIYNTSTYAMTDEHSSTDVDVVTSDSIAVNKGDVIQVAVNTPWDSAIYSTPAGTVNFTASFAAAEGTENNPIWIYDASEFFDDYLSANSSVYYSAYGVGGMYLDLYAGDGVQLELNGEVYTADKYGWINVLIPNMGVRFPTSFAITNTTDHEANYWFYFYYPYGSMNNPAELVMGKNSVKLAADDQDGFSYAWVATDNGYLTITMSGSKWSYVINNLGSYSYGDIHDSTEKPAVKSETIKVNAGDEIIVNVAMPRDEKTGAYPAGTVTFTATFNATELKLLSGKSTTLKFTDPATGKTVSASKVNWTLTGEGATLSNAKLTADKGITEPTTVEVLATLKADETVVNTFFVTIYPAATEVQIYNEVWNDETQSSVTEEVTGDTVYFDITYGVGWPNLYAVVLPFEAMSEVTWKSSNTKIANMYGNGSFDIMWNDKKNCPAMGTVTLTATAADGSGVKASTKVVIFSSVAGMALTDKNGNTDITVGAGKSVQLVTQVYPEYATNQKVSWSLVDADGNDVTEELKDVATIKNGKLTASKKLTGEQNITVRATALDGYGAYADINVTLKPAAAKVIVTSNAEGGKWDMNTWWPSLQVSAEVLAADGSYSASQDVVWSSSNNKIATVNEYGYVECIKPGTVTFTATATDGSNKKASVKITITKSVSYIEMPYDEAIIAMGKTLNLNPTVYATDASNKKLNWTLTYEDGTAVPKTVATISNGKLSAKNVKNVTEPVTVVATCTATDGSYVSASCNVTIYPATTKVTILKQFGVSFKGTQEMTAGEKAVYYAECTPDYAADEYTWKSSNEQIAQIEVNSDGSVTIIAVGEKTGTVTITATAADGTNKKASFKIKVNAAE